MNRIFDFDSIKKEIERRRIALKDPDYGQQYLDAMSTLSRFSVNKTILDEHIDQLKSIKEKTDDIIREHPNFFVFDVITFVQEWGSTSLGFDGVGGDAMTEAVTTIIMLQDRIAHNRFVVVFFADRLAYMCEMNDVIWNDIDLRCMASVKQAKEKYYQQV